MAIPTKPTITYPNGGEIIATPTVSITWVAVDSPDSDGLPVLYDIYYADSYENPLSPEWIYIGERSQTDRSFLWNIPSHIQSNKVRVAVLCRNSTGQRSGYSVSAASFTITRKKLSSPQVITPVGGGRYDKFINIILSDDENIQSCYVHLAYASVSRGVPLTTISQSLPSKTTTFQWDTSSLPAADDYEIHAYTYDRLGNASQPAVIKNIQISHEGQLLVDTKPPVVSVDISGNSLFSRNREIGLSVYAYDEGTGVHSFLPKEGSTVGSPQSNKTATTFVLSAEEGSKKVSIIAQDFGANRNTSVPVTSFIDILHSSNADVVDACSSGDGSTYVITSGETNGVYKVTSIPSLLFTITDTPTAVAEFALQVYVATYNEDITGSVNVMTVSGLSAIHEYTDPNEYVVGMSAMGDSLFWATNTGRFERFDGDAVSLVLNFNEPISRICSDGGTVYVSLKNNTTIWTYNGSGFSEVSV